LRRPIESAQFTSIRYVERLAEIGATPSIGSVGDSYDNALAETVNGYYKAELIRGPARQGPWKTVEEVELATLGWVHWHNTQRLHGYLDDLPPVEFEQAHAARTAREDRDSGDLSVRSVTDGAADRLPQRRSQPESAQIALGSLPETSAVAAQGPGHSRSAAPPEKDRIDQRTQQLETAQHSFYPTRQADQVLAR